ncbi:type II toxin-antitoxin system PemK/MazF family toxin [Algoriphagus formosus]|jgi:mRNA interferase MazF|uniref:type II toxin-antitoxin system PemK/MazF family toxin n=1 Tax=Algoriphagus formosus TaxID=2007308 RepID=UPI003F7264C3
MKKQFEIWLVNLNPSRGVEPGKIRPAVVVQTNLLNQVNHPSTLICPITSQLSKEDNILRIRLGVFDTGLDKSSEILIDQIRALDNRRFLEKLGELPKDKAFELREKLTSILDL